MKIINYKDIVKKVGLPEKTATRYIKFMRLKYPNQEEALCIKSYATLWANRFLNGTEYQDTDSAGQNILHEIDK